MPYDIDLMINNNPEKYRRSSLPYDVKLAYDTEDKTVETSLIESGLNKPTKLKNRRKSVDFEPDAYEIIKECAGGDDMREILFNEPSTTATSSPSSRFTKSMSDLNLSPRSAQIEQLHFIGQDTTSVSLFSLLNLPEASDGKSNDYVSFGLPLMIDEEGQSQVILIQNCEEYPLNKNILNENAIKQSADIIKTWDPLKKRADINLLKPIGDLSLEGYWGLLDYFNCLVETWLMQRCKRNARVFTVFPDKVVGSFHDYAQRVWKPHDQKNTKRLNNNEIGVRGFNEELKEPIPNKRLDRKFASQLWRGLLWLCPDFYVFDKVLSNGNGESTGPPSVLFNVTPLNPITRKPFLGGQNRDSFEYRRIIVLKRLIFLQYVHQRDYLYCCLPKADPLCRKLRDNIMTKDPMYYQWTSRFLSFLRACLWSYLLWPSSSNTSNNCSSNAVAAVLPARKPPFDRFPLIFRGGVFNSVREGDKAWPANSEEGLFVKFVVVSLLHERFKFFRTIVSQGEEDELKEFRNHPMDYIIRYLERKDSRVSN